MKKNLFNIILRGCQSWERKEKLLKKQHRQALMLDNMIGMDAIAAGRSFRDEKPVTYTFDDYDRSIDEVIKFTKKNKQSPKHFDGVDPLMKHELSRSGSFLLRWEFLFTLLRR
ncbi:DDT domain-containing protein DDR4-like [Salvia splendens]|uniref:DDT domain-containing protein DDR4-like n=1 Tax=Salvia splendens TaxID=180675 RepID=UPI001C272E78|nr:DDT domain-containing protein DDR4-like [Salvia splendens]